MSRYKAASLAACVIALIVMRYYGWQFADMERRGELSKALGALQSFGLVCIIYSMARHKFTLWALLYSAFEDGQSFACSLMYMHNPWPVRPGHSMCSELTGLDIGALTIIISTLIVARLYPVIFDRSHNIEVTSK